LYEFLVGVAADGVCFLLDVGFQDSFFFESFEVPVLDVGLGGVAEVLVVHVFGFRGSAVSKVRFIPSFMTISSWIVRLGGDDKDIAFGLLIKFRYQFRSISEIVFGFPGTIFIAISFPFDKVLGFPIARSFLDNCFGFELLFIVDDDSWRGFLVSFREFVIIIGDPRFQEADMEDRVYVEFVFEVQFEGICKEVRVRKGSRFVQVEEDNIK